MSGGWIKRVEMPERRAAAGAVRPRGGEAENRAAGPRINWRRVGVWLGVPLYVMIVAFGWWRGAVGVRESRRELQGLLAHEQELATANRDLARQVKALREEREARARAARESLDVAAPDEVIVIVPPSSASPSSR